jgi:ankyrin repeat protein
MAHGDWKDMFKAVEQNDLELLDFYIRQGVDLNYQHPEYFTGPLFEGIRLGNYEMVKSLLEGGASVHEKEIMSGKNALELAEEKGQDEIIKLINSYTLRTSA